MFKDFFITIDNPQQTDDELYTYVKELKDFWYCVFQREKGGAQGNEHIHMFLTFFTDQRFLTIREYFPTAHIEVIEDNSRIYRDYCIKSYERVSGPYEFRAFDDV